MAAIVVLAIIDLPAAGAPKLDFMRGRLTPRDIAEMSGRIWDHLPMMLPHFEEAGIAPPRFKEGEMADLIAYLHSGLPREGAGAREP